MALLNGTYSEGLYFRVWGQLLTDTLRTGTDCVTTVVMLHRQHCCDFTAVNMITCAAIAAVLTVLLLVAVCTKFFHLDYYYPLFVVWLRT